MIWNVSEKLGFESESASFVITAIGITDTIGLVILGYVMDQPWLNRRFVFITALTICGLGNK